MRKKIILFCLLCIPQFDFPLLFAQAKVNSSEERIVGFYNIENLFDIYDDPATDDSEFLPNGSYAWTAERYQKKLDNISKAIASFRPMILGLAEIENRTVLEDLVAHANVKAMGYQIVHFDMKDERGIDVALLYRPTAFKPFSIQQLPIFDPEEPDFKTRDILMVKGLFLGDTLHVAVNHWPSRRGPTEDKRLLAAKILRTAVDSILQINPKANIVIMGDLNDDPNNKSVRKILVGPDDKTGEKPLVNASEPTFKNGRGTLAFNGVWNLFDQIILSSSLTDNTGMEYKEDSFTVAAQSWMLESDGRHKGTPKRTFRGTSYTAEGFSDHLPVFVVIHKK